MKEVIKHECFVLVSPDGWLIFKTLADTWLECNDGLIKLGHNVSVLNEKGYSIKKVLLSIQKLP